MPINSSSSGSDNLYKFETVTGSVTFDHDVCLKCESKVCIKTCVPQILKEDNGVPILNITKEDAKKNKCTECLACEVECEQHGLGGGYVDLPIENLEEYRNKN